jgi:hypothetical protein
MSMFGGGRIDLSQLGAMILAANNNPLGMMALRQRSEAQQAEREAEARAQQRQQTLADQRNEWLWREQWQRQNPQPGMTERFVQEIMDPNTPPDRRELLRTIVTRPIQVYDPASGNTVFQYPGQGGQQPRGLTDAELDAMQQGGPQASNPAGSFP